MYRIIIYTERPRVEELLGFRDETGEIALDIGITSIELTPGNALWGQ